MGSNPVQAWTFLKPYFHYSLSSSHYCENRLHIHQIFLLHDKNIDKEHHNP